MVRTAPQWISGFLELDQTLPSRYGWRYSSEKAVQRQIAGLSNAVDLNRVFWTDQARNVEAYSMMSMWRGSELLKPAIRSLNVEELITPAVLARSLLELSTAYLLNANTIERIFNNLTFPANTVVLSKAFEEQVVRMIWGRRIGDPEPHLKQTNVLTLVQKLAKNPRAADLLPHYEYLCEIAHPNVVGNSRFWSHVERVNDDGSEARTLARVADGPHAVEIQTMIIWSIAWSAGSLRNSFAMIHGALDSLLAKLGKPKRFSPFS